MVFGLTMYFRFHYPCMPPTMVILATHLSSILYSCHHHQPLTHAIAPLPNSDHKGIHILVCLALALLTSCCTSSFLKWASSKLYDSIMVLILHKTAVFLHWAIHNPVADPGGVPWVHGSLWTLDIVVAEWWTASLYSSMSSWITMSHHLFLISACMQ